MLWPELDLPASEPAHDVLYIGKAEDSLRARLTGCHFADKATARSTLRRTLAALLVDRLGLEPVPVSSAGRFTLDADSGEELTAWMSQRLAVRVWEMPAAGVDVAPLSSVERAVLTAQRPPLNLTFGNADADAKRFRQMLRRARTAMGEKANQGVGMESLGDPGEATVGNLFLRYPGQFGLRASVGLWEELAERLENTPMPTSGHALGNVIREALDQALDGAEPYERDKVYVERFDRGGMSAGLVHLPWWEEWATPLLEDRWGAWAHARGLLGPENYLGG